MAFVNVAIGLRPIATFANDAISTILHFFKKFFWSYSGICKRRYRSLIYLFLVLHISEHFLFFVLGYSNVSQMSWRL